LTGLAAPGAVAGLVPFVALPMPGEPWRPWYDGTRYSGDTFQNPADLAGLNRIDPAAVLSRGWPDRTRILTEEDAEAVDWMAGQIAPFSWQFPGPGPGQPRAARSGRAPRRSRLAAAGAHRPGCRRPPGRRADGHGLDAG
jgi:hypothetical protein